MRQLIDGEWEMVKIEVNYLIWIIWVVGKVSRDACVDFRTYVHGVIYVNNAYMWIFFFLKYLYNYFWPINFNYVT